MIAIKKAKTSEQTVMGSREKSHFSRKTNVAIDGRQDSAQILISSKKIPSSANRIRRTGHARSCRSWNHHHHHHHQIAALVVV